MDHLLAYRISSSLLYFIYLLFSCVWVGRKWEMKMNKRDRTYIRLYHKQDTLLLFKLLIIKSTMHFSWQEQPLSILDITLEQNQQSRTLREHFSTFVKEHYPFLGKKIYIVPEKPPISQKQPDKLLVRAREGQYRWSCSFPVYFLHIGSTNVNSNKKYNV